MFFPLLILETAGRCSLDHIVADFMLLFIDLQYMFIMIIISNRFLQADDGVMNQTFIWVTLRKRCISHFFF